MLRLTGRDCMMLEDPATRTTYDNSTKVHLESDFTYRALEFTERMATIANCEHAFTSIKIGIKRFALCMTVILTHVIFCSQYNSCS